MQPRQWIAIGALWAGLGVVLGAFGAHSLHERLDAADQLANWHTAVRYQVWHALALIAYGLYRERRRATPFIGWAFLVGSFLFSGSIYGLTQDVFRSVLGPITPLGGVFLICGWVTFAVSALRASDDPVST